MKKILTTLLVSTVATLAFAQGTVYTLNTGSGLGISTNTLASVSGAIAGAGDYYFALLTQTAGAATTSQNPVDGSWQFAGVYMTNIASAGVINGGASATTANGTWANNTTQWYIIAGWSANEGATWATVANELTTGNWAANGFFGVSAVGSGQPGGGTPALPAYHLFGTTVTSQGTPVGGFLLNAVSSAPVPEPTTMALAGLGSLSLFLFRRRK